VLDPYCGSGLPWPTARLPASKSRLATTSNRKDTLYVQVLLACALAKTEDHGFFAASDVRDPMRIRSPQEPGIPSFGRHLKQSCKAPRGPILQKSGTPRRFRFRFKNPLMQPYVIIGFASRMLNHAGDGVDLVERAR
jgi:hypothetical protein